MKHTKSEMDDFIVRNFLLDHLVQDCLDGVSNGYDLLFGRPENCSISQFDKGECPILESKRSERKFVDYSDAMYSVLMGDGMVRGVYKRFYEVHVIVVGLKVSNQYDEISCRVS